MGRGKDGVCAKVLQSVLVTEPRIPYGNGEGLSGCSAGRAVAVGEGRSSRCRALPLSKARPRCGRGAQGGQRQSRPVAQGPRSPNAGLLWPSSSLAISPFSQRLPAAEAASSRTRRSPPAASPSPCPGASPGGAGWDGMSGR